MATYHILIQIDELRRDIAVNTALAQLFNKRGVKVKLCKRIDMRHYLRFLDFDAIMVSNIICLPYDLLPKISSKCFIYMLTTEGAIPSEYALKIKYCGGTDDTKWRRRIDCTKRFFLWGDLSRRIIEKTGMFQQEQLFVSGGFRMDYMLSGVPGATDERSKPYGLLTNFANLNPYHDKNDQFQSIDSIRADRNRGFYIAENREVEDRYWLEVSRIRIMLEFLDECKKRGKKVMLRVHPRENLDGYEYLCEKYSNTISLEEQELPFEAWMRNVSSVVGYNSTTFYEAVTGGIQSANLESLIGPRFVDHRGDLDMANYDIMKVVFHPESFSQLFDYLQLGEEGKWEPDKHYGPIYEHIKDMYDFPRSTSALAKIVDVVLSDLSEKNNGGKGSGVGNACKTIIANLAVRGLDFYRFKIKKEKENSVNYIMRRSYYTEKIKDVIDVYVDVAANKYPSEGFKNLG